MILRGEKVVLRPIKIADAPRFVKWFNDPQVNKFTFVRSINLPEEKKFIKNIPKSTLHFCIDTISGRHIGAVSLDKIAKRNRSADFGIAIGDKNYWSKGFGGEAAKLIIDYGFNKLKLHRIYLTAYVYNKRAVKLYEKLGFKYEGLLREANFWNGRFWDTHYMSILDREWKRRNKK